MMTKPPERRPPFYLLTGLIIGLILGIVLVILFPAAHVDLSPTNLADEYKAEYRLMVALAYASSGNIGRAQARLAILADGDPVRALASQAQLALADSNSQREARALASLAADIQILIDSAQSTSAAVNTPNPDQQGAVATPFQTTAENAVYHLTSQELLCESADSPPLVKIFVFDDKDNAQAGVRITMTYTGGSDEFFTGAKPEFGPGYADYELTPGPQYTLSIQGTQLMGGLQAAACETEEGEPAWGSWLLLFNAEE
jgi:cytoskeletal protein RodZ